MEKEGGGSMLMMNSWCRYLKVAGDEETFDIVGRVDSGIIWGNTDETVGEAGGTVTRVRDEALIGKSVGWWMELIKE